WVTDATSVIHCRFFFLAFDFDSAVTAAVKGLSASRWRCAFFANFASRIARSWSTRGEGCLLMCALSETVSASYPFMHWFMKRVSRIMVILTMIAYEPRLLPEGT